MGHSGSRREGAWLGFGEIGGLAFMKRVKGQYDLLPIPSIDPCMVYLPTFG